MTARCHPAFTLPELLITTTIVAVLMSLLWPSLVGARRQSHAVVCGAHLKDLGVATAHYVEQSNDWLPGAPGTSGLPLLVHNAPADAVVVPSRLTQTWDWATPLVSASSTTPLSGDRPTRVQQLRRGVFACTANPFLSRVFPDSAAGNGWPAVLPTQSYATIREFLYFGKSGNDDDGVRLPFWWNLRTPRNYRPRRTALRSPSRKVWMAEGTPYWAAEESHDTPMGYRARYGGAYSTAGPSSSFSRAYVNNLERTNPVDGTRQPLQRDAYAYRHTDGSGARGMETLFFDGHVQFLRRADAIRTPDLWYPGGTLLKVAEFENGPYPKPAALAAVADRPRVDGVFYPIY